MRTQERLRQANERAEHALALIRLARRHLIYGERPERIRTALNTAIAVLELKKNPGHPEAARVD